jgi:arylformamidase
LVAKKGFKGVGIDSLSIDAINSTDFAIHKIILGANIFVLENVNNLDLVKDKVFEVMCFPLKIEGCDGSPLRVVARLL